MISRYGVGYDNVDVEAATRKGIWVARVPDYCFEDVADHALALLLGCVRKIAYKDRMVRQGRWNLHRDQPCYRIDGKDTGHHRLREQRRAACIARSSASASARCSCATPTCAPRSIRAAGAVPVDLASLLAESDYISVHVPLTPETRHMIGGGGACRA